MSTATAPRQQNNQQAPPVKSSLDTAIEETGKRQSLIDKAADEMGVEPTKLLTLLRNVWKTSKGKADLTNDEMFVGISLIARYGLDPIAREIYVTRGNDDRLMTIIGIDGWIKVLDRTEGYDGFDQEFGMAPDGEHVAWVETKIFSKYRSHPATYRAFASEYGAIAGFMAKKIPSHMLRLFSLRHAARLFTPIGGSVMLEEEAGFIDGREQTQPVSRKNVRVSEDLMKSMEPPAPSQVEQDIADKFDREAADKAHAAAEERQPDPPPEATGAAELEAQVRACADNAQLTYMEAEIASCGESGRITGDEAAALMTLLGKLRREMAEKKPAKQKQLTQS